MIKTQLVDRRNWGQFAPLIADQLATGNMPGLDIETSNHRAHEALRSYKKGSVFDPRRTTLCGLSIYVDGDDTAYYINIEHADVENRVPWKYVKEVLDHKPADTAWIIHNAPFEITMLKNSVGYEIDNFICSLQMAVSAYNDDSYDIGRFNAAGLGDIHHLMPDIANVFADWVPNSEMNEDQAALFRKVVAKESDATHSYNGLINSVRYGFGLKEAVLSWFGHKMTSYQEVLGDKAHMGELTGAEVAAYGADDAYWCVRLAQKLIEWMGQNGGPNLIKSYFEQELPVVSAFADVWIDGWKVNVRAVESRTKQEQADCAVLIQELKEAILPFIPLIQNDPSDYLKREKWYNTKDAHVRYRQRIVDFVQDENPNVMKTISGAVPKSLGLPGGKGPNFTHYMMMRTLFHDIMALKPVYVKGSITSDAEARGRLADRVKDNPQAFAVVNAINKLAGVEQRMKLYLTPYSHLVDPETGRLYPQLSSMLNSRRMASRFPNPMQLTKRGGSTYIRGFYEADSKDHLLVSQDWAQFQLVLIGDQSEDPEFKRVFGTIPYDDLHIGTTAALMSIEVDGTTVEWFKRLKYLTEAESASVAPRILTNLKGLPMDAPTAYKYWRNELGKVANFGYWFSGALSDVAERMGWSSNTMWEAVERYRERFPVAEQWRVDTIHRQQRDGYLTLPDGHRRYMYEATPSWASHMKSMFSRYKNLAVMNFGNQLVKRIQSRAGTQGVNSLIQGTEAAIAKRTVARNRDMLKKRKLKGRFVMPVHDELVWNIHKNDIQEFLVEGKRIMTSHPDIVRTLPLDCTSSIGRTFEPFDAKKAPYGQIELDEAPDFLGLPKGSKLDGSQIQEVINYLTK